MLHYASGTPANDEFQVVENQLARQRLFSVHPNHFKPLLRWVDDIRMGIVSFGAQLDRTPSLQDKLVRADNRMRQELSDRGCDPQTWVPYEDALRNLSNRLGPGYPRSIMLDSGAFTDWGKGRRSDVDKVIRSYADFLERSVDLFDEIYLINLDVIPGEKGRRASEAETIEAVKQSDANFAKLKSEFDVPILPVFHQDESLTRLNEVVDMADGFICLSPNNDYAQNVREDWTLFHNTAAPGVRCHGLATTGNRTMRNRAAAMPSSDVHNRRTSQPRACVHQAGQYDPCVTLACLLGTRTPHGTEGASAPRTRGLRAEMCDQGHSSSRSVQSSFFRDRPDPTSRCEHLETGTP